MFERFMYNVYIIYRLILTVGCTRTQYCTELNIVYIKQNMFILR